jgi:hypothetical protein
MTSRRRSTARRRAQVRRKRVYAVAVGVSVRRPVVRRRPFGGHGHTVLGVTLLITAVAMAGAHLAEHADALRLMSRRDEDLLIGFPTASALGLAGFVAIIWR